MNTFEYRVIPAPTKAKRGRWVRGAAARFADRLQQIFNEMGADGWEYVRTDTLPCEERRGLTQKTVTYRNLLVFRKVIIPEAPVKQDPAIADQTEKPIALLSPPNPAEMNLPLAQIEQTPAPRNDQPSADEDAPAGSSPSENIIDAPENTAHWPAFDDLAAQGHDQEHDQELAPAIESARAVNNAPLEERDSEPEPAAQQIPQRPKPEPEPEPEPEQADPGPRVQDVHSYDINSDALDLDEVPRPLEDPVRTPMSPALALRAKQAAT